MSTSVLDAPVADPVSSPPITIDFLYVDLEVCTRCVGTDANLDAALAEVSHLLETAGGEVTVGKTLVASEEQARALGFVSSPTIRVNGRDIAPERRESRCESCESLAGNGTIDCRLWIFGGREYTEAPKAMIVDAILRAVYGRTEPAVGAAPEPVAVAEVPENLRRFFAGKEQAVAADAACCPPAEQAACCEPSAKAGCCGAAPTGSCGCT